MRRWWLRLRLRLRRVQAWEKEPTAYRWRPAVATSEEQLMSGNPHPVDSSGVELADVDIADDFLQRLAAVEAAAPSDTPNEAV